MSPLQLNILSFILLLYSNSYYPRKIVQEFVDYFDDFIRNFFLPELKKEIFQKLKEKGISDSTLHDLEPCFSKYSKIFEAVSTEHKRFNLLKQFGYVDPEEFLIGRYFKKCVVNQLIRFVPESMYGIQVRLRYSLKSFLEIPGLFNNILKYMKELKEETNIISNIMQAQLWTRIYAEKFSKELVFPLFIFYDDLEVGNAMGSHSGINKFGAIYAIIANLPPYISSRLSSILFTSLIHSEDKKKTTNANVFKELIKEINFLRHEGILICVDGLRINVKFQLLLILGDNLGLNGILGFVESFKASFCCRICKMSSDQIKFAVKEDNKFLRVKESHESDSAIQNPQESGVKEKCVFHEIDDFHVTENLTVDMMHDVLEGACLYDMKALMKIFIFEKEYFTLEMFNTLLDEFDYGPLEFSNKPPIIKVNRLKNNKVQLNMSAAEMLCFVRYFGLIVGHLIPEFDEHYKLYKYLRQIIDIITSPRITKSCATFLEMLIEKHNLMYIKLFGSLKPKFHYLIHYPRILLQNGPFIHFWSMRCESRHTEVKANTEATFNTRNLLLTIAKKQTLKMCHTNRTLNCDDVTKFRSKIDATYDLIRLLRNINLLRVICYREVEISAILYKTGMFIVVNMENPEKEFGQILCIIQSENNVFFHVKIYKEFTFNFHHHAYEVYTKNEKKIINYADLPNSTPCLSVIINKITYVASRCGL